MRKEDIRHYFNFQSDNGYYRAHVRTSLKNDTGNICIDFYTDIKETHKPLSEIEKECKEKALRFFGEFVDILD